MATPAGHRRHVLINPSFGRLWVGQSLSGLGDMIFETTLIVWIAAELAVGRSWSALAVTGVLAAAAVPVVVVGPIAGALIDRWRDKRGVILRANAVSFLLILVLIPAAGIVPLPGLSTDAIPVASRLIAIFVVVFLASGVAQFLRPAAVVLMRDLVDESELPRAVGLGQTASSLSLLVGPSLAAPLLFAFGPGWALLINAASFAVAYVLTSSIAAPPAAAAPTGTASPGDVARDIVAGLRFFRRSRVLTTVTVTLAMAMFGLGAVAALDVFFVTSNMATPVEYYGFLVSAQGGGMVLGSIAWGLAATRIGLVRSLWIGMVGLGVAILVYSRMTSFVPGLVVTAALGLVIPAVNVAAGPIALRVTPRELTGRVMATLNPLIASALLLGQLAGGLLYAAVLRDLDVTVAGVRLGPLDTIFAAVGLLCVAAGLFAARNLRLPDQQPADPDAGQPQEDLANPRGDERDGLTRSDVHDMVVGRHPWPPVVRRPIWAMSNAAIEAAVRSPTMNDIATRAATGAAPATNLWPLRGVDIAATPDDTTGGYPLNAGSLRLSVYPFVPSPPSLIPPPQRSVAPR